MSSKLRSKSEISNSKRLLWVLPPIWNDPSAIMSAAVPDDEDAGDDDDDDEIS